MITRIFSIFSGFLVLGSVGAFFLFVPVLSIAAAICVLTALILMFALGLRMGQPALLSAENVGR